MLHELCEIYHEHREKKTSLKWTFCKQCTTHPLRMSSSPLWAPSHLAKPSPNALSIDYSSGRKTPKSLANLLQSAYFDSPTLLYSNFPLSVFFSPAVGISHQIHPVETSTGGNYAGSQSSRQFLQVFTARPPGGASESLQDFQRAQRSLPQLGRSQPPAGAHHQESALYTRNTHTRKTCTHLSAFCKSFYIYSQAYPNPTYSRLEKLLAR